MGLEICTHEAKTRERIGRASYRRLALFFTKGQVCGENNIVAGRAFSTSDKSGMEKHKEQLKMLFFNPGKRISGLPFMSGKTAIYDDDIADAYDMSIDMDEYNKTSCYIFKQKVKPGREGDVVVDEMRSFTSTYPFKKFISK